MRGQQLTAGSEGQVGVVPLLSIFGVFCTLVLDELGYASTDNVCIGLLGELDEEREGLLGDEVLGEVEDNVVAISLVAEDMAEFVEALRVWRVSELSVWTWRMIKADKLGKATHP